MKSTLLNGFWKWVGFKKCISTPEPGAMDVSLVLHTLPSTQQERKRGKKYLPYFSPKCGMPEAEEYLPFREQIVYWIGWLFGKEKRKEFTCVFQRESDVLPKRLRRREMWKDKNDGYDSVQKESLLPFLVVKLISFFQASFETQVKSVRHQWFCRCRKNSLKI